jgi:hypothetical protein
MESILLPRRQMSGICHWLILLAALGTLARPFPAAADVVAWRIERREPYASGKSFGIVGPYERWRGKVRFAFDTDLPSNRPIVDLELARRGGPGQTVEAEADFEMLVPVQRDRANGCLFYEVNNRGNKTAPNIIDGGGDEFLCRQGFVVLWSGWISELLPGGERLRLTTPPPLADGQPVRGVVRYELVVEQPSDRANIAHRANIASYPPAAESMNSAVLTRREREADRRQVVPRSDWKLIVHPVDSSAGAAMPRVDLELAGGLQPGWIYEVLYQATSPIVPGIGLAAIRDVVASLKYDRSAERNPLIAGDSTSPIRRAIGFGTSQSGRCLRHFLLEGFNADEQGRKVFDGVISHVAGGGLGSFNHRFASPNRTNGQHEEQSFAADFFPFTYGDETDPHTGKVDGILRRARQAHVVPKLFHTQSSSEYWHRAGSLVHTDPMGERDSVIPNEVRIYTFAGTQHSPGSGIPASPGNGTLAGNPADYRPFMRALVRAMDDWVRDDREPPPSVYPRIDNGTLVDWRQQSSGWPAIPGVAYPQVVHVPCLLDRGPEWDRRRIATIEPPRVVAAYRVRIPAFAADGNERGALSLPAIQVPVGSYTGWNLRSERIGAAGELLSLQGGFIPFAKSDSERANVGDPRPALQSRYRDYADYHTQYRNAASELLRTGYLLDEDLPRLQLLCEKFRDRFDK